MPFYIGVPSLITPVHCITQTEEPQLAITYQPNYGEAYYNLALATYDDTNPSSRVASLNYLQKAANALIKTGNLELYQRAVEWMLKMQ
ncbi:hypothetical protein Q3H53_003554 [Microcystis aeruginosa PCC 7806]|uniref:Similarity n=1 Tax=Microcystis aeruginosa (strain PCC 7806) TaxID=267872 RepID=A8YHS5_MICA7|nr:hypothetical protein [Microcystis aeruginosa]WKX63430.1 hypothetical protein Q3H53_003554 [Microcystis aeruginosa PCC 7806]CAO90643.1 unnamed protein product [Microcystis aeruginosa PCC 7806]